MDNYTTTKQLLINTQLPAITRTYSPFSHEKVMDLTLNAISNAGFILENETYAASKGLVATGKYTIKSVADSEMQLQIAWLNSYDKSKRLTWGVGSIVRICLNGMISADMGAFKKKHQGEIQEFTPKAITEYVKRAEDVFLNLQQERESMKQIEVSQRTISTLIGQMFLEEDFITTTQLNIIKRELESPTHDYGADGSLWQLYNFATFSLKGIHPSLWMKNHLDCHKFFTTEAGILINNTIDIPHEEIIESPFKQLSWLDEVAV
jgi:hypothetical protein